MTAWQEHADAAAEMGLDPPTTLELFDGWPAQVKASRERLEAAEAMLDAFEELEALRRAGRQR